MSLSDLVRWFAETDDIFEQVIRHLYLSYAPVVAALAIALPVGLYIGHRRRFEFAAVTLANLGRAVPSFAILSLALIASIRLGLGLGFWPTFAALFLLSLPPILVNSYIGVKGVDPDTIEAARGMGMSEGEVLRSIELPLALPLIVTGIRTAAVQSVATATLGGLVAAGGLGSYIILGFRTGVGGRDVLVGGAILVAVLAIATEFGLGLVERLVRPRGTSGKRPDVVAPLEELTQARRPSDMVA